MRKIRKAMKTREIGRLQYHVEMLGEELEKAADFIDELLGENMALRLSGERMAEAIEYNSWDVDSAIKLVDSVSAWREFQERVCDCEDCANGSVFAEDDEQEAFNED